MRQDHFVDRAVMMQTLADGIAPDWAAEWGSDRAGSFAGFAVGGVVQRMRWIPPGRFEMGSPESEAGRDSDEGPRHEVTISQGFWLAETPCTQALWEEVMGDNPSRFKSADRPVELVSWDDCQQFLQRLGQRVPGLGARLPTESEWEYACRAGTETATWVGDLTLRGENDAPELDAIAWYGGNSGHGYELAEGSNSSDWPQKQYPHTKAGTRPVRGRKANPRGLYDLLGNVSEWCADWYGAYEAGPIIDPVGPPVGANRVLRGGSWVSYARVVRAARRFAFAPGLRLSDFGFRLARGQDR